MPKKRGQNATDRVPANPCNRYERRIVDRARLKQLQPSAPQTIATELAPKPLPLNPRNRYERRKVRQAAEEMLRRANA